MRIGLAATLIVLMLPCLAVADTIYMNDGTTIEGKVLSMDETEVKVLLPYGTLSVKRENVKRMDFGLPGEVHEKKEAQKEIQPAVEEKPVTQEKPAVQEKPQPAPEPRKEPVVRPRSRKNPTVATALAVIPGGGYVYLGRPDMAIAALAAEAGLVVWGASLAQKEGEGSKSTANLLFGFAALIKVAELVDTHDRAVSRNKSLSLQLEPAIGSVHLVAALTFH